MRSCSTGILQRSTFVSRSPVHEIKTCMYVCICINAYIYVHMCICLYVYVCVCSVHPLTIKVGIQKKVCKSIYGFIFDRELIKPRDHEVDVVRSLPRGRLTRWWWLAHHLHCLQPPQTPSNLLTKSSFVSLLLFPLLTSPSPLSSNVTEVSFSPTPFILPSVYTWVR